MRGKDNQKPQRKWSKGITPACAGKSHCFTSCIVLYWDHPRVCGEKDLCISTSHLLKGSPPRVRGKEVRRAKHNGFGGITPACAGKRFSLSRRTAPDRDHPRVCGEKIIIVLTVRCILGSPPRVRGKVVMYRLVLHGFGITPACAGKSPFEAYSSRPFWDHPRVCGEKETRFLTTRFGAGSPPRVRGKVNSRNFFSFSRGITPACAGKSICLCISSICLWDHPRVCGEKEDDDEHDFALWGSPPRVRGKAERRSKKAVDAGITPACAGKSRQTPWPSHRSRDHPRVCGEKTVTTVTDTVFAGSPPRVRGKAVGRVWRQDRQGITPACAGKSSRFVCIGFGAWDHPRVCGEKQTRNQRIFCITGSPPRVRGKGGLLPDRLCQPGITPACAGKRCRTAPTGR